MIECADAYFPSVDNFQNLQVITHVASVRENRDASKPPTYSPPMNVSKYSKDRSPTSPHKSQNLKLVKNVRSLVVSVAKFSGAWMSPETVESSS